MVLVFSDWQLVLSDTIIFDKTEIFDIYPNNVSLKSAKHQYLVPVTEMSLVWFATKLPLKRLAGFATLSLNRPI